MKFEQFTIGQTFKTDAIKLTKKDIMQFAGEFDPQYMHLDEEKARNGKFNGIIASGIHTLNISFKLWIELGIYGEEIIAGRGMNNVKFLRPVYPGDELHVIAEVSGKKKMRQETGIISVILTTYNDKGEKVFKGELSALVRQ